ncbi:MAG: hypothetical protein HY646_18220, partial [Acidobacteria bacterium]|nr:hypothetical protein [Acidobacteriota bacterium]
MNHLKVVEFREGGANEGSRYFEVAAQVRALLQCEYAIIATAEGDSLTVRAIAGANTETSGSLAVDLLSKLRDWGPVVVDDSRLVAVPVTRDQRAVGLILGYSSKPGTFNSDDLGKLTIYSHVVSDILDETSVSPLQRGTAAHERSECKPDRAQPSSEGGRGSLTLTSPPSSTGETRSTFT